MSNEPLHAHGATCTWGTTSFQVFSFSLDNTNESQEIDITSMSSAVTQDPNNTDRNLISRDFDSCFSSDGNLEMKIEFFGDASLGNPWSCVGHKRPLSFNSSGFKYESLAILSAVGASSSTGEFIKGSAVFRLTNS